MRYYIITTNPDEFIDYAGTDLREAAIAAISDYERLTKFERKRTTIEVYGWVSYDPDDPDADYEDPDEVLSINECYLAVDSGTDVYAVFSGSSLPDTFPSLEEAREYAYDGDTISRCLAFGSEEAAIAYYGRNEELTESSNDDLWMSQAALLAGALNGEDIKYDDR